MGKQRNWNHKLHQNNNVKENSATTPRIPSPDCKEPQSSPTSAASKNRTRSLTHSSNKNNIVFHITAAPANSSRRTTHAATNNNKPHKQKISISLIAQHICVGSSKTFVSFAVVSPSHCCFYTSRN